MRTHARTSRSTRRPVFDEEYFERKAQDLVVPDDEIEAWEVDTRDFGGLAEGDDFFNAPGSE
jgi:hypothetical protein